MSRGWTDGGSPWTRPGAALPKSAGPASEQDGRVPRPPHRLAPSRITYYASCIPHDPASQRILLFQRIADAPLDEVKVQLALVADDVADRLVDGAEVLEQVLEN